MTNRTTPPTLSQAQQVAAAKLAYALEAAGSLAILCGPAGVGKTLVLHAAVRLGETEARTWGVRSLGAVREMLSTGSPCRGLPDVLLIDDAHLAEDGEMARLVDACRAGRPEISVAMAGEGRLLTLLSRDSRVERLVRLRATLPPFSRSETRLLVAAIAGVASRGEEEDDVAGTIHELAAGIPADVVRLAELAAVVADGNPGRRLTTADIELIHRRLAVTAA